MVQNITVAVSILLMVGLVIGGPSFGNAGEKQCDQLPSGSVARNECERDVAPLKIVLFSKSEIKADKAWFQGDRVFYERRGFTGSVSLASVETIVDQQVVDAVTLACSATESRMKPDDIIKYAPEAEVRVARSMPGASDSEIAKTTIDLIFKEHGGGRMISGTECAEGRAKLIAAQRQLELARERATEGAKHK